MTQAAAQQTLTPIWYLAWVRQVSSLMRRPISGQGAFTNGQQVFFWPMGDGKWMVFDGKWLYTSSIPRTRWRRSNPAAIHKVGSDWQRIRTT